MIMKAVVLVESLNVFQGRARLKRPLWSRAGVLIVVIIPHVTEYYPPASRPPSLSLPLLHCPRTNLRGSFQMAFGT